MLSRAEFRDVARAVLGRTPAAAEEHELSSSAKADDPVTPALREKTKAGVTGCPLEPAPAQAGAGMTGFIHILNGTAKPADNQVPGRGNSSVNKTTAYDTSFALMP